MYKLSCVFYHIESTFIHNSVYSPPAQASSFGGHDAVYFNHLPPSITADPPSSQTSAHFYQYPYHPTQVFETSNHHPFRRSHFQTSSIFPSPLLQPSVTVSSASTNNQEQEVSSKGLPPRWYHLNTSDRENKLFQQRPASDDFEYLHNTHHLQSSHHSHDNCYQSSPQSYYDFSSYQQPNNSHNNSFRLLNNNRYQRNNNNNNNTSLPLSAYMNIDHSPNYSNIIKYSNNNHRETSHQKRWSNQQRTRYQDKHRFPISSYDPRQYGSSNNYQRRNGRHNQSNLNRRNINNDCNNNNNNNRGSNASNNTDLIEEWWEDTSTELTETNLSILNTDSKTTTLNDSGNSSLSTSMHLKESTFDDLTTNEYVNPPSDVSTTDSMLDNQETKIFLL